MLACSAFITKTTSVGTPIYPYGQHNTQVNPNTFAKVFTKTTSVGTPIYPYGQHNSRRFAQQKRSYTLNYDEYHNEYENTHDMECFGSDQEYEIDMDPGV